MVRFYTKLTRFTDRSIKGMRGSEGSSVTASALTLDGDELSASHLNVQICFLVSFFFFFFFFSDFPKLAL